MSNYIRKQDALDAFNRAVQDVGILDADDIETVFGMLSSADVAPVVHAHWSFYDLGMFKGYICSECHRLMQFKGAFCPHCGAKMDGERKE